MRLGCSAKPEFTSASGPNHCFPICPRRSNRPASFRSLHGTNQPVLNPQSKASVSAPRFRDGGFINAPRKNGQPRPHGWEPRWETSSQMNQCDDCFRWETRITETGATATNRPTQARRQRRTTRVQAPRSSGTAGMPSSHRRQNRIQGHFESCSQNSDQSRNPRSERFATRRFRTALPSPG